MDLIKSGTKDTTSSNEIKPIEGVQNLEESKKLETQNKVNALYQRILQRDADPVGMEYAVNDILAGHITLQDLEKSLLESQEYKVKNAYKILASEYAQMIKVRLMAKLKQQVKLNNNIPNFQNNVYKTDNI
jgi:Domain of unknown function (DUF4214)